MGRAADRKHKRRQADARRQFRAGRAVRQIGEEQQRNLDAAAAAVDAAAAGAASADEKAAAARVADVVQTLTQYPQLAEEAAKFAERFTRDVRNTGNPMRHFEQIYPVTSARVTGLYELLGSGTVGLCEHLQKAPGFAFLCAVCADQGLVCLGCSGAHSGTEFHGDEEYRCDECGQVDRRGVSALKIPPVSGVPVTLPGDLVPRILPSMVIITGLGFCEPCRRAAGRKAARLDRSI